MGGSASCAKSRCALFAKNSNCSKKPKNFIFVPECANRRVKGIFARFGGMACLVELLPAKQAL